MPFRQLPATIISRNKVLEQTSQKVANTAPEQMAISSETQQRLQVKYPVFRKEIAERQEQLARQAEATLAENNQQLVLHSFVSHFIRVFNMGVERGKYAASDRLYFGLNANQNELPKLRSEQDLVTWAKNLIAGEEKRVSVAEGDKKVKPMANPSIAEVQNELDKFLNVSNKQAEEKQAFDTENKDVLDMLPEIDDLIRDIYDEVEFYYRKETAANRRKLARQWGVQYVSRSGEAPTEEEEEVD
jgi:hypothetical protein